VLSGHLKRVAENDILVKTSYAQRQERYKYRLTEKGLALYLILMSMANWAGE
jgi:DNA-binding HxlR family transcriptional regulator